MKHILMKIAALAASAVLLSCSAPAQVFADAEQEFTIDTWLKVYVNIEAPLPDETIEHRKVQVDPTKTANALFYLVAPLLYNGRITEDEYYSIFEPVANNEAMPEDAKNLFVGLLSTPEIALETMVTSLRPVYCYDREGKQALGAKLGFASEPWNDTNGPVHQEWQNYRQWLQAFYYEQNLEDRFQDYPAVGFYYDDGFWLEQIGEVALQYETSPSALLGTGIFGDANQDGELNAKDTQAALIASADIRIGLTPQISAEGISAADVDGDGTLTVKDAQYILMYYANTRAEIECSWQSLTGNLNAPAESNLK